MRIKELLELVPWRGFEEGLFLGLSEAEELGKEFLGFTLSNGHGLVLHVNPYEGEVKGVYLVLPEKIEANYLNYCCVFNTRFGNTIFIYEIINLSEYINSVRSESVIYVEVIKGELEDFLHTALVR